MTPHVGPTGLILDCDGTEQAATPWRVAVQGGALRSELHAGDQELGIQQASLIARAERQLGTRFAAGISVGRALADTSEEDWDRVFAVNAKGTFLWFKAVLPGMLERGRGSLIAIASQLAVAGPRSNCSYAASKGAVVSLVKSVALDYADKGIRANALLPGATETPLLERAFARRADPNAARETLRQRHPAGRFGRPEEIAAAALFLASDESSFVTGAALPVDGGFLAG